MKAAWILSIGLSLLVASSCSAREAGSKGAAPSLKLELSDGRVVAVQAVKGRAVSLVLADSKGNTLQDVQLAKGIRGIQLLDLGVKGRTYIQATADTGGDFGSHVGETIGLYEVGNRTLTAVTYLEAGKKARPLTLSSTLKSGWKFVEAKNGQSDFLTVRCHPGTSNGDAVQFEVELGRIRFDGNEWRKSVKIKKGFWESDNDFPMLDEFPL